MASIPHCMQRRWEGFVEHRGLESLIESAKNLNYKITLEIFVFPCLYAKLFFHKKHGNVIKRDFCTIFKCVFLEIGYCLLHLVWHSLMNNSTKFKGENELIHILLQCCNREDKMLTSTESHPQMDMIVKHKHSYMWHISYMLRREWATPCRSPIYRHACCTILSVNKG